MLQFNVNENSYTKSKIRIEINEEYAHSIEFYFIERNIVFDYCYLARDSIIFSAGVILFIIREFNNNSTTFMVVALFLMNKPVKEIALQYACCCSPWNTN